MDGKNQDSNKEFAHEFKVIRDGCFANWYIIL